MRQCALTKGNVHTVAWIPDEHAVAGHVVDLKISGEWDGPWLVERAFRIFMEKEHLNERVRFPSLMKGK